jgi:hypothetical protein
VDRRIRPGEYEITQKRATKSSRHTLDMMMSRTRTKGCEEGAPSIASSQLASCVHNALQCNPWAAVWACVAMWLASSLSTCRWTKRARPIFLGAYILDHLEDLVRHLLTKFYLKLASDLHDYSQQYCFFPVSQNIRLITCFQLVFVNPLTTGSFD